MRGCRQARKTFHVRRHPKISATSTKFPSPSRFAGPSLSRRERAIRPARTHRPRPNTPKSSAHPGPRNAKTVENRDHLGRVPISTVNKHSVPVIRRARLQDLTPFSFLTSFLSRHHVSDSIKANFGYDDLRGMYSSSLSSKHASCSCEMVTNQGLSSGRSRHRSSGKSGCSHSKRELEIFFIAATNSALYV